MEKANFGKLWSLHFPSRSGLFWFHFGSFYYVNLVQFCISSFFSLSLSRFVRFDWNGRCRSTGSFVKDCRIWTLCLFTVQCYCQCIWIELITAYIRIGHQCTNHYSGKKKFSIFYRIKFTNKFLIFSCSGLVVVFFCIILIRLHYKHCSFPMLSAVNESDVNSLAVSWSPFYWSTI